MNYLFILIITLGLISGKPRKIEIWKKTFLLFGIEDSTNYRDAARQWRYRKGRLVHIRRNLEYYLLSEIITEEMYIGGYKNQMTLEAAVLFPYSENSQPFDLDASGLISRGFICDISKKEKPKVSGKQLYEAFPELFHAKHDSMRLSLPTNRLEDVKYPNMQSEYVNLFRLICQQE